MVRGIESFREWFRGYEEQYAIIGGTACDLLMTTEGLDFRATKDIDLVLIIEAVDAAFGKRIHVSEVTVLDVPYLIPFKARAWIDLSRRKAEGEHIDSKTIRKHKNDVFRLTELLDPNMEPLPYLPDAIKTDMNKFTECMRLEKLDLKQIGIQDKSKESILEELKVIYGGEQI